MMRLLSILFVLSLLLNLSAGCSHSNQNIQNVSDEKSNKSGQESIEIRIYEVFGMDCPGCHGGVEKLIKKIPGVQNASANWKKKELKITVEPGSELNDEDVYNAVKRANFTPGKRLQ